MFWLCAPLCLAHQSWGSYTGDSRDLHDESPEVSHRCFTVHKTWKNAVSTAMFTLFSVRKSFAAAQHTFLCSHTQSPFPRTCPLPTSCHWRLMFLPDCSHPSVQRGSFTTSNLVVPLPQLELWPLQNVSLSSPSFSMLFCTIYVWSPLREKKKGDTGPSGNFFLTSSPFYANISRCWDTGRSSCFLSHFKVYWLCRRWKLRSRLLELKAICLPFDQTWILFCQT